MRLSILPSDDRSRALSCVEHPRVAGLVAAARRQEAAELLAGLLLAAARCGRLEALGAALRGDDGGEIGELLGLQGEELVAGLRRLQRAGRDWLDATSDDISARLVSRLPTTPACTCMRVLEAADRVLPALACAVDQLLVGRGGRSVAVGRARTPGRSAATS